MTTPDKNHSSVGETWPWRLTHSSVHHHSLASGHSSQKNIFVTAISFVMGYSLRMVDTPNHLRICGMYNAKYIYHLYANVNGRWAPVRLIFRRLVSWQGADALVRLMTACTTLPIITGKDQGSTTVMMMETPLSSCLPSPHSGHRWYPRSPNHRHRWYRATHIVGDLFFWQARPPCIIIRIGPEIHQHLSDSRHTGKVLFLWTMWPLKSGQNSMWKSTH